MVIQSCASLHGALHSPLADEGVLIGLTPSQTEQTLSSVLKSRGTPVVARDEVGSTVRLKFKGPDAALYAHISGDEGLGARLRLFGTSVTQVNNGRYSAQTSVEIASQNPPSWLEQWAHDINSTGELGAGNDAVNGTLIELQQSGVRVEAVSPGCHPEVTAAWAGASAREKAKLLAACHGT
jgi:hypothetical protein